MRDRGMIKWAPFNSVINGNDVKKEIKEENNKIPKPTLSEEQIFNLEQEIIDSYQNQSVIELKYYKNQHIYKITGIITKIDSVTKKIVINNDFIIYFNNIIQISKKNT